jgi:alcohol dehydrogenase (cytochrome c)
MEYCCQSNAYTATSGKENAMIGAKKRSFRAYLCSATLLCDAGAAAAQTGATWEQSGGTPQGTRYSSLTDITSANVSALTEEFSFPTGTIGAHQGGPLVVGTIMYVVTPWPNKLIALDLTKAGAVLWTYAPPNSATGKGHNSYGNRGAAYASGLVVYCELDGHVVAVNASTGAQVWRVQVTDPNIEGETLPIAPIIVNGKVIFGDSLSEMGARGSVRALDLKTGKLLWKAFSTGPDTDVLIDSTFKPYYAKDQGPNLGATTWPGTLWQHGGSTTWEWITYDPETNLIFYGTAQPGTFNPDQRPGDNKWGASVFARNPDTGKAVWAYQLTPHDNWDYDATNEYTVVDLTIGGTPRKALVHFSKNGFAYVFDRTNGSLISATPYSDGTNWASGYDLATGLPQINKAMETHQGKIASGICPSALGGKDWEYSSYSPATGLFYFGMNNFCMHYQPLLTRYIPHASFFGVGTLTFDPSPHSNGSLGALVAWDPVNAKLAWSTQEALPLVGPGTLSTAGGLVFYGTADSHFKALDAKTGAVLWSTTVECPVVSNPISFTGADGKQRIAVYSGTNSCPVSTVSGDALAKPNGAAVAAKPAISGGPEIQAMYRSFPQIAAANSPKASVNSGYLHVYKLP